MGLMVNAVSCVAASTGTLVEGLVSVGGPDASGHQHPGLPRAGCSVLTASPDELDALMTRAAAASDTVLVIDMPAAAQTHRTYDDYLNELAVTQTSDTTPGRDQHHRSAQPRQPADQRNCTADLT